MTGSLDYHVAYPIAITLACAVTLGLAFFVVALVRALAADPNLVTPLTGQAEQVAVRPPGPGGFPPDLAWPGYPFRQWRADFRRAKRNTAAYTSLWRRAARWFFVEKAGFWLVFPLPAALVVFLFLSAVVSWLCFAVYTVVTLAAVAASRAVLAPAAAALRTAEHRRRTRTRTQAACMHCFHVTDWPGFRCPSCLHIHHDVRPGRLGLLFRRCECGTHLPTMASRATWRVTPVCQRCGTDLPQGAGGIRDIRVPVFGDTSAGKTRFLYASLSSLTLTAQRTGLNVSFPDQESRDQAEFGLSVIRSARETAKTSTNARVCLTVRLGSGRRSELVHLFDAAGEHFRRARHPDTLRFLDDGHGLVYILDPFSVTAIRERLGGEDAPAVRLAQAAAGDPELTYDEVASRLRDTGVPASHGRLAVVVSKADLLRDAGLDLPVGSRAIAQWLWDLGVHNLVMAARRDFAQTRFFTVASQALPPGSSDDPGAPLRWLLRIHGSGLPPEPSDGAAPGGRAASPDAPDGGPRRVPGTRAGAR